MTAMTIEYELELMKAVSERFEYNIHLEYPRIWNFQCNDYNVYATPFYEGDEEIVVQIDNHSGETIACIPTDFNLSRNLQEDADNYIQKVMLVLKETKII